jgi:phosphoheptose isomerase
MNTAPGPVIDVIRADIHASIAVKHMVLADEALLAQVARLADTCLAALRVGGKVIFAGNGGSFADAQHLSAEFTMRFMFDRAPLASLTLGTNNWPSAPLATTTAMSRCLPGNCRVSDDAATAPTSWRR